MTYLPKNLPALLRAAGLTVVEVDGWQTRGRPASTGDFSPTGVLNHHTGASAKGWTLAKELIYAKWMFLTGRPDLPPPLVQISLGRSATVYIGAAGRANHAGTAKASGSVAGGDGNTLYVGIEWMLSGTEPIPADMMAAGVTLNAVLTEKVTQTSTETVSCHYNTSVTGKWDIGDPNGVLYNGKRVLDIVKFRTAIKARREMLYSAALPDPTPTPAVGHDRTLRMITFNAWVGNKDLVGNLRRLLADTERPEVLAVQEAGHPVSITGYTAIECNDTTTLLVRQKGVKILGQGILDARNYDSPGWQWGPKGQPKDSVHHQPKQYPWARIEADGQQWVVLAGHRVVSGFRINRAEWAAEDRALLHWFSAHSSHPCLTGMDWNDTLDSGESLGVAALAERVHGRAAMRHIDGVVGAGVRKIRSERLPHTYGSDAHHPILVTATK